MPHAGDQAAAAGHHAGPDSAACKSATPMQRCKNPPLCAEHDESVAGHIFHHVSDEVYVPICLDRGGGWRKGQTSCSKRISVK